LIHEQFEGEEDAIAVKCREHGLDYVIVNGLDPVSNRAVVDLCARHPNLVAACGIYPLDAACNVISPETWTHPFPPPARFDIEAEVAHIESLARSGQIVAVGECGLDKHYLTDDVSMAEQERVLRMLARVAKGADVPLILHSRKQEERLLEILLEEGVVKADIHWYTLWAWPSPHLALSLTSPSSPFPRPRLRLRLRLRKFHGQAEVGRALRGGGLLPLHPLGRGEGAGGRTFIPCRRLPASHLLLSPIACSPQRSRARRSASWWRRSRWTVF